MPLIFCRFPHDGGNPAVNYGIIMVLVSKVHIALVEQMIWFVENGLRFLRNGKCLVFSMIPVSFLG